MNTYTNLYTEILNTEVQNFLLVHRTQHTHKTPASNDIYNIYHNNTSLNAFTLDM